MSSRKAPPRAGALDSPQPSETRVIGDSGGKSILWLSVCAPAARVPAKHEIANLSEIFRTDSYCTYTLVMVIWPVSEST